MLAWIAIIIFNSRQQVMKIRALAGRGFHAQRDVFELERLQAWILQALDVDLWVFIVEVKIKVAHPQAGAEDSTIGSRTNDGVFQSPGRFLL